MSSMLIRAENRARITQFLIIGVFALGAPPGLCWGQAPPGGNLAHSLTDSDHDGISDVVEQALLQQFAPTFMIASDDCAGEPAQFRMSIRNPEAQEENGTIYGQVFPAKVSRDHGRSAEIHYYHLWGRDCGGHAHALDAEHVSVLVHSSEAGASSARWTAEYWYAAAHEDTICDISQIARASTLGAEEHGARIWISPGKHASFLDPVLCERGCGADRCDGKMRALTSGTVVNLGEPGRSMNQSLFIESNAWPLAAKMKGSNFPESSLTRLNNLPANQIVWFKEGRHPSQGIIAISSTTEGAIMTGGDRAAEGVSAASEATGGALDAAQDSSGNALQKSYRRTRHAIGISARRVGEALHITARPAAPDQTSQTKEQKTSRE